MARVLVTGMSGVGKSTVLAGLELRGHSVLDTDVGGWVMADGRWDAPRMSRFLDARPDVAVAGTVENQGDFYDTFDHVVLLSVPLAVMLDRVRDRSSNPYGRTAAQRAEIAEYTRSVEPLLRATATLELDGRTKPDILVDVVEALVRA